MPFTPDLFSTVDDRFGPSAFGHAFDSWRASSATARLVRRESSVDVYKDMWGAFTAWCLGQSPQVTLLSLDEEDLARFIASREETNDGGLSARYRWRLLSLIDRVLGQFAVDADVPKNDAASNLIHHSAEIREANISERPRLDYLDAEQARRLVKYLSNVRPEATGRRKLSNWQELRNLAAVALHLGAGVTPGDLRDLPLDAPVVAGGRWADVPWKLRVPGNGNRAARETPVAPWAGRLLRYWLTVRAELSITNLGRPHLKNAASAYLFPGRSGQQWGKMAHYEAVRSVMEGAGVEDPGASSGGAFRLRHTFALRQFRRKKHAEDIARWMGIVDLNEMDRYRAVLASYEEAV